MQRFVGQHVNGSESLLRSARNQIHKLLTLILDRESRERLVLVISEFLGHFFNTLTAD